mgnify:CR=1 FL=1
MKWFAGSLVFLSELGMYAGLFWWGYTTFPGFWGWLVGLAIPFFVSVLWSLSLSPKAPRPLPTPVKTITRLVLLLAGAVAWWLADAPLLSIITAAFALVGTAMAARWPIDEEPAAASSANTAPADEE